MYGIDEEKFEERVGRMNNQVNEINNGVQKIKTATEMIANIFRNNDLGNISSGIEKINNNNRKIAVQAESYVTILRKVQKAYHEQTEEISQSIKHAGTDL